MKSLKVADLRQGMLFSCFDDGSHTLRVKSANVLPSGQIALGASFLDAHGAEESEIITEEYDSSHIVYIPADQPTINYYSSFSRLEETAEELCEEHGYSIISRTSSEIVVRRGRDGFTRALKLRVKEW